MASVGDLEAYQVGKRFVCEGFTGTILYVGKVPPTEGKWSTRSEGKRYAWSCDSCVTLNLSASFLLLF